jgi:hypothetical protein
VLEDGTALTRSSLGGPIAELILGQFSIKRSLWIMPLRCDSSRCCMTSMPLLILSDAPSSTTGLGRITRDLATRIHANLTEFRVGCLSYGGPGSLRFGFPEGHL